MCSAPINDITGLASTAGGIDFQSEIDFVNCGLFGCNIVFSRKLTGLLSDLASILEWAWTLPQDAKDFLNDPNQQELKLKPLLLASGVDEDQYGAILPIILTGVNSPTNDALQRVLCDSAGEGIEDAVREEGFEREVVDYLGRNGSTNGLRCTDLLAAIDDNGFNLQRRLADDFRVGAGREKYECVGVHILVGLLRQNIADIVWESYSCRQ